MFVSINFLTVSYLYTEHDNYSHIFISVIHNSFRSNKYKFNIKILKSHCPWYDTKLHPVFKLNSGALRNVESSFRCYLLSKLHPVFKLNSGALRNVDETASGVQAQFWCTEEC